jgi:transposase InsO family protein
MPIDPALRRHAEQRRQGVEDRTADQITRLAGSMRFVYLHVPWLASWTIFVVVSRNRAEEQRQVQARLAALPGWLHAYNYHRPHTALGGRSPMQTLNNVPENHT